ncbi:nucleolar protein dao-5-like [Osmerus mordax]|uniref:nucleolar protein dao-5-like n=1 Tax=Osmerus mordax TaxID=8014 RepID=UPI00350FB20F
MLVTSQHSPAVPLPSIAKKVVLQSISSLQGAKLYRQPNGQLVKLVAVKPKAVVVGKNPVESPTAQPNQSDNLVPSRVIPPLSTPGLPPSKTASSPRSPPPLKPLIKFITGQHGTVTPSRTPSPSPLALTVSSSMKTPSFLGQRGTYSFRIFPPPADQASKGPGQSQAGPAGVSLPGGFTLIQLPKPGAAGVAPQSARAAKPTTLNMTVKPLQPRKVSSNGDMILQSLSRTPTSTAGTDTPEPVSADHSYTGPTHQPRPKVAPPLPSGPRKSPLLTCDEEMASEGSDAEIGEVTGEQMQDNGYSDLTEESGDDSDSDDLTDTSDSDDSDDDDDDDDRDETVDIETVEERTQRCMIAEMRAAARHGMSDSLDSSQETDATEKPRKKHRRGEGEEGCEEGGKRRNHTVTERLRRSEHRKLFTKLKDVLFLEEMDPKASKLLVLSQARREINALVNNSAHLEEKKRRLTLKQSAYVKKIAHASGKPEELIRSKVREICERQKDMCAQRNKAVPPDGQSLTSDALSQAAGVSRHTVTVPQPHTKTGTLTQPASLKAAGRGVLRLKVTGIPSPAPPTAIPATAGEGGEAEEGEGGEAEEGEGGEAEEGEGKKGREVIPSNAPEPSGQKPDTTDRKRGPMVSEQTSGEKRPKEEEEEEEEDTDWEAHASHSSVEEDVSSNKEKIDTPVDKTSDPKLADMSLLGEMSGLNSAIWKPQEQLQAGGNPQTNARSLRKKAAVLVQALSKDERREGPDSLQDKDVSKDQDLVARTKVSPRKRTRETSSESIPVSPSSTLVPPKRLPLLLPKVQASRLKPVSPVGDPPATAGDGLAPAKRGRGRPPKKKPAGSETEDSSTGDRGSKTPASTDPESPAVEISLAPESPAAVDCLAPAKRGRGRPPKKKSHVSEAPVEDVSKTGTSQDGSSRAECSPVGTKPGGCLSGTSPATRTRGGPDTVPRAGESPLTTGSSPASPARVSPLSKPVTRSALGKDFPSAKRKSWTDYLM